MYEGLLHAELRHNLDECFNPTHTCNVQYSAAEKNTLTTTHNFECAFGSSFLIVYSENTHLVDPVAAIFVLVILVMYWKVDVFCHSTVPKGFLLHVPATRLLIAHHVNHLHAQCLSRASECRTCISTVFGCLPLRGEGGQCNLTVGFPPKPVSSQV